MNAIRLEQEHLRLPPHSIEAEQGVLGALMLSDSAFDIATDILGASDFYRSEHRVIYHAIEALAAEDKPRDVLTMSEYLETRGELKKAGDMMYLGTLAKDTPSAANIKAYAQIVREKSLLRQYIAKMNERVDMAYSPQIPAYQLIDETQGDLMVLQETKASSEPVKAITVVQGAIDRLDTRFNSDGKITGLPTGFDRVDAILLGLQPTNLVIVAGRPSMGKTTFAMNIAENVAIRHNKTALVFSMEMSKDQLIDRSICSIGRINFKRFRTGKLEDHDWPRVTSSISLYNKAEFYIDDSSSLKVPQMLARARRIKKQHGLDLVVVDYLQLMESVNPKLDRTRAIGEFSRGLKRLAKELHVPVIALSQLNRDVEKRHDKRPMMSDLRESGDIEQDADVIIFMYRDEVYNEDSPDAGIAECLIRKHRDGEIGTAKLASQLQCVRFDNLAERGE